MAMNKTIISILFTQYAKYPNTKINENVTQLNENVQIKFGINANELIRNLFVFDIIYKNYIPSPLVVMSLDGIYWTLFYK